MSFSFSRASSIPYFVVFTTTPRSSSLAREIAADATISLSLLRQVTINKPSLLPPTPPHTPSISSDDSDIPRRKLLKHVKIRASRCLDDNLDLKNRPLSRLPTQTTFSESRILQTSICIGFPKRPRNHCDPRSHPSLNSHASLPDGLHKAKILLDKAMLPCIDWAGVNVKVFISHLFYATQTLIILKT